MFGERLGETVKCGILVKCEDLKVRRYSFFYF